MADPVDRLNTALEGRYRLERELGEGGMATVYLTTDLRHNRNVALKVLKPELAAVVGAERFLAEIETTAKLQHPHILPLFDSGEADGFLFYVMPYVEGESLRERLERERQLPVDEAVAIASKVADALDYAHEHGVIHRDIKPANVLLSERGEPLVADFGIALAVGVAGGGRLTETGLSLGTPHYMSPEQATGDGHVGPAADVYALGCVLYETLTGEPPFTGGTAQAVLGKIIAGELTSATQQRPSVPPNVDAAIQMALEKVPADRFKSAQAFETALADPGFRREAMAGTAVRVGPGPWKALTLAFASLFVVASGLAVWALVRPEPPSPVARFESPFRDGQEPAAFGGGAFNLSPDGSILVYRGPVESGTARLWMRRWDDLGASPIRGTEGGVQPAVSFDGRLLAFLQGDAINVLDLDGGPIRTLVAGGIFPRWGPDGYVYFRSAASGVLRVPATGGSPEPVTELADGEATHWLSEFLPGGTRALVRVALNDEAGSAIKGLDLTTGTMTPVTQGAWPRYAASGHLVFLTALNGGTLMAAPFDPDAMELTGPAVPIVEGVIQYALSARGDLVYTTASQFVAGEDRQLVWVTRSGAVTPVDPGWRFHFGDGNAGWSLSPAGDRLAIRTRTEDGFDIWVKELDDGPLSRVTFDEGDDRKPRWAPDGETLTFLSNRAGNRDLWTRRADGTGDAELLFDHEASLAQGFFSPDGEWLVMRTAGSAGVEGGRDILIARPRVDSVARPILAEEDYDESAPAVSFDSRWIAYVSTETGRAEVFVRPFPDVDAGKVQVSVQGGVMPYWAHGGQELFYAEPNSRSMISATFETIPRFRVLTRESMFTISPDIDGSSVSLLYAVTADDQRFVMSRLDTAGEGPEATSRYVLVQNFFEELDRLVPN